MLLSIVLCTVFIRRALGLGISDIIPAVRDS